MKLNLTIVIAISMAIICLPTKAQQLTPEQAAAETAKQADLDLLQAQSLLKAATLTLRPDQELRFKEAELDILDLHMQLLEAAALASNRVRAQFTGLKQAASATSSDTDPTISPVVSSAQSQTLLSGEDSGYGLDDVGNCGSNPYVFYNLPPFTDNAWDTVYSSQRYDFRPWAFTDVSVNGTNKDSVRSYVFGFEGNTSQLYSEFHGLPVNHIDQFGDPVPHILSFWYKYISSVPDSQFYAGMANDYMYVPGYFKTNLSQTSGLWSRKSVYVNAFNTNSSPYIVFVVERGHPSTPYTGPDVFLDASVQWCPVITPMPTTNDMAIQKIGNTVKVQWSTLPYRKDYWNLQFAADVNGPYSTNIQTTVTYTGNLAYATFPATNNARFYRLKHK